MPRLPPPCIRNCQLDGDDICIGCHRSLDEVKSWRLDTVEQRREILDNTDSRQLQKSKRLPTYS